MYASSSQRIAYFGPLFLLLPLLLVSGCATGPVADVKQFLGVSQYYVKSNTLLRSRPDHTAKATGNLSLNSKVTEVTRNNVGWSQVKSVEGKQQGWLPVSLLSKEPVAQKQKPTSIKKKSEKPAATESKPTTAKAVQESKPAAQADKEKTTEIDESSGLLSPESAEAATIPEKPKPKPETSGTRKSDPDMFDAF